MDWIQEQESSKGISMTPAERKRTEGELLDEYREAINCLSILDHKLRESLRVLSRTFDAFEQGKVISSESIKYADEFRVLVQDYRETYERCATLRTALSSWESVIAELPHPQR